MFSRREDEANLLTRSVTMPSMPDPLRQTADEERRVLLLGAVGVGKTALGRQFLTSEYTMAYEQTIGGYMELGNGTHGPE